MEKLVVINESYVSDYYRKRQELNALKKEVDEMSNNIKTSLLENKTPLGKTYGGYVAYLSTTHRLNDKFVSMLKNNGMEDRITEMCYVKDCKDIIKTFSDKDKEMYYDEWYKQLFVTKKNS